MAGPLQMAHQRFHKGQVIPCMAGWFGEIGNDIEAVVKLLARERDAVAVDAGE